MRAAQGWAAALFSVFYAVPNVVAREIAAGRWIRVCTPPRGRHPSCRTGPAQPFVILAVPWADGAAQPSRSPLAAPLPRWRTPRDPLSLPQSPQAPQPGQPQARARAFAASPAPPPPPGCRIDACITRLGRWVKGSGSRCGGGRWAVAREGGHCRLSGIRWRGGGGGCKGRHAQPRQSEIAPPRRAPR